MRFCKGSPFARTHGKPRRLADSADRQVGRRGPRGRGPVLRNRPLLLDDRYAIMARSIHAVFSCTCIRWVSRSAVGSSLAASTAGNSARAVRTTVA